MSYSDDYDDGQELVELSAHESSVLAQMSDLSGHNADKAIRRRSSKGVFKFLLHPSAHSDQRV